MSQAPASEAEELWAIVKGIAEVALPVLAIVDPPIGIALAAAITVADAIIAIIEGSPGLDNSSLEANLTTISHAALLQAAPHIKAVANAPGAPTGAPSA